MGDEVVEVLSEELELDASSYNFFGARVFGESFAVFFFSAMSPVKFYSGKVWHTLVCRNYFKFVPLSTL